MKAGRWGYVAAVLLALGLGGCATAVMSGAGAGGYEAARNGRSEEAIRADQHIVAAINAALVKEPTISAFDVGVQSVDGVVTLRGTVEDARAAARAVALARRVPGVRRVISHLYVRAEQ